MPQDFPKRIDSLASDLEAQGRRVQALLELAFDAFFNKDGSKAAKVNSDDDDIDSDDIAVEKACVSLLIDATSEASSLGEANLRRVLTIVKVNNELERIADGAVDIAALISPTALPGHNHHTAAPPPTGLTGKHLGTGFTLSAQSASRAIPPTFRMMANSVVGILRDTTIAVSRSDAALAKVVLQSQHCVTAFKDAILRDAEQQIAKGTMPADFAFLLHEVASQCEIVADHCTNIAEQVIYASTGAIVRHTPTQWIEIPRQT